MDANERLIRAVQHATRKLAGSGPFDSLLRDVLSICVEAVGAAGGTIYTHDPATRTLRFQHVLPEDVGDRLPFRILPDDFGVVGRVFHNRQAETTQAQHDEPHQVIAKATGVVVDNMVTVPLMVPDEEPIGVVQLINKASGNFTENDVAVLEIVSNVSALAFMNHALSEQSARALQLLGMGRVAHDIKNMAAAQKSMVDYVELPLAILNGELGDLNPDPETRRLANEANEMLGRLRRSLELTMDYTKLMSDLSSGIPLRPELRYEPMADTIATSVSYYEPQCRQNGVALVYQIQTEASPACHDRLYMFRICQNLVSNAIKAVMEKAGPEGKPGSITVRYRALEGQPHIVEVEDTGPGMSREIIERVLAGRAGSMWEKAKGSGWGTKIVLNLVEAQRGSLEIDSEVGVGTTFRVLLPAGDCPSDASSPVT